MKPCSNVLERPPFRGAEMPRKRMERLVHGLGDSGLARSVEARCRDLGWEVIAANGNLEAGRLAQRRRVTTLVLSTETSGESGVLTCAKVRLVRPSTRIVLVGPECERSARDARFAGADHYVLGDADLIAQVVLGL